MMSKILFVKGHEAATVPYKDGEAPQRARQGKPLHSIMQLQHREAGVWEALWGSPTTALERSLVAP